MKMIPNSQLLYRYIMLKKQYEMLKINTTADEILLKYYLLMTALQIEVQQYVSKQFYKINVLFYNLRKTQVHQRQEI